MKGNRRVLFVDDEPTLLRGLRRMLSGMRGEWEMEFVESGPAALAALAERPFDVVVSDMRMPGMNGAELLNEVKRLHPHISRIILSGHSDQEAVMQVVGPAHQYLSKPCNPEVLHAKLSRTFQLRDVLGNSNLHKVASSLTSLPAMPEAYRQLIEGLATPGISVECVAEIVSRDIGFSAKVLQLVNSEFFGLAQRISNPREAVHYLGLETIRALVLGVNLFGQLKHSSPLSDLLVDVWRHSLITAVFARRIMQVEGECGEVAEQAFTAGLMHDVGKLIMAEARGEEYRSILQIPGGPTDTVGQAEYKIMGTTHAELGAYLLGLWGLPDPILEAVAFHHSPDLALDKSFSPLTAVHVADYFERSIRFGHSVADSYAGLDVSYLERVGKQGHLDDWRVLCQVTAEEKLSRELIDLAD